MNSVMGVDLGTQSIKVIIYQAETKQLLAQAACNLDLITDEHGASEQLTEWWVEGLHHCLNQFDAAIKASVVAMGVSGQQHGFVPVAADGRVLSPVKLWCDTSTVSECEAIIAAVGGEQACRELAGNSIAVGYTASKILYLKNNNPDAYQQMTSVLLPHDYLNFYLTGQRVMEYGDASGTGLLDIRQRQWCQPLVNAIDPDLIKSLPPLISAQQAIGAIKPQLAAELGLSDKVIVSSGGGDNMMAAIGTGNVRAGRLTASMGTSGTLFAYAEQPVVDSSGDLAAFCSSTGGWLPLLCTMNCTVATERMRALFEIDVDELEALATRVPSGSDGVLTLPYYNGERTPNLPEGKAVIFGLDMHNSSRGHLLRSAMEAAVFSLKAGLQAFQLQGMLFDELVLTGGGSRSALWCQICANVLGLPLKVLVIDECAAFGAALQALWCYQLGQGEKCELVSLVDQHLMDVVAAEYQPEIAAVEAYGTVYKQYQQLLAAVKPLY